MGEDMSPEVLDAAIIASAQKIEHYEICGYGTARAFARELQLSDISNKLTETHKKTITVNGKNIRLTIPAGIENGQAIKLRDQGSEGVNGGPKGDLYITFIIENDTPFRRDRNDLYSTIKIDLYTAVLGGEINVDTMKGKVKLKVAPETQNGTKTRLKGKGFPVYKEDGKFGDLFITYEVVIPKNLSDRQKELFTELSKLSK
jgi:curved DNA-binding protein